MGRKAKFSKEIKIKAIKDYQEGNRTKKQIATILGCNVSSVNRWINSYKSMGEKAFDIKPTNKVYTKKLKLAAINNYLNGVGSLNNIIKKYKTHSISTLINWLMMYNDHKEIKDYKSKGDVYMAKSKKNNL
ncbi:transposase [Mycoplasmatota bacterium]|nr:transposase [Mycoplasmatota bacterium]